MSTALTASVTASVPNLTVLLLAAERVPQTCSWLCEGQLVRLLPLLVWHAVDTDACPLAVDRLADLGCGGDVPFGEVVSAEASQLHQADVLDILAGVKMGEKMPEGRRFSILV